MPKVFANIDLSSVIGSATKNHLENPEENSILAGEPKKFNADLINLFGK